MGQYTHLPGQGIGIVITATGYSAASVTQAISGVTPPTLGGASLNGGSLEFTFTSTPSLTFTVLGATNVALPLSQWQVLGNATEGPPGNFQFSDPSPATNAAFFYTVTQP